MLPLTLIFLYGVAAGYLLVRLRRGGGRHRALLEPLGWVMLAASLTLAVALLAWLLLGGGGGGG